MTYGIAIHKHTEQSSTFLYRGPVGSSVEQKHLVSASFHVVSKAHTALLYLLFVSQFIKTGLL